MMIQHTAQSSHSIPYEIVSFQKLETKEQGLVGTSFQPYAISRLTDGVTFKIGDRVSNGTAMCGKIYAFTLLGEDIFVETDYSGVGMGIDDIFKVVETPTKFQQGERVKCDLPGLKIEAGAITKVHMGANSKTQYDLQVWYSPGESIRLHNIDEKVLEKA